MSGYNWLQVYQCSRQSGDIENLAGDYELRKMDSLHMGHCVLVLSRQTKQRSSLVRTGRLGADPGSATVQGLYANGISVVGNRAR